MNIRATLAKSLIAKHNLADSFYIYDLDILKHSIQQWRTYLPMITPFYAIKCNPDPMIIRTLAEHGAGFDCASPREIDTALQYVSPSRIIYAHPCKHPRDITYARQHGIIQTTFDSESELDKLHDRLRNPLLRIKIDNPNATVQLGLKYGADPHNGEVTHLLKYARNRGIDLKGVSFHIGSANRDPTIYRDAITISNRVLQQMRQLGFSPTTLNIGGGFTTSTFQHTAPVITQTLDAIGAKQQELVIMAEPGRYFAERVATFFTPVIGVRKRSINTTETKRIMMEYWIGDGLYGSFNCILYDHQRPQFELLTNNNVKPTLYDSIVWGATCDSADRLNDPALPIKLPKLALGDWLMVPDFGAYTIAGACDFNGIPMTRPKTFYIMNESQI